MGIFNQLVHNSIVIAPIIAWCTAQIAKTIIHAIFSHEFVPERIVGGGGMPSSHSATVCALTTSTLILYGPGSFEFAMAFIFSMVTMYDAMGVRRETGRQGEVLNDVIAQFKKMGEEFGPEKALKELIGHSPLQVGVGALFGIAISLIVNRALGVI